jgi:NADP-dependent 3-hydroxy acid dehydrogenase YdfG
MTERKSGHIINIGSIAGKEVYPNGNVYCASKFAVDALTGGMRMDLNSYGIKVTSINPGLVDTEFAQVRFKGDMDKAENVYKGMQPLKGEDIADTILYILSAPAHVLIADLTIFPTAQASATIVNRK